jgi:hypothetical protein
MLTLFPDRPQAQDVSANRESSIIQEQTLIQHTAMVTARRPRVRTTTNYSCSPVSCPENLWNALLTIYNSHKLYSFLARRTDSAFNQVVLRRLRMSKMHRHVKNDP